MPSPQDTAYPRLKSTLSAKELTAIYTPSPDEFLLARRVTKNQPSQLGFLVLLKTFQRLGYAILVADVPVSITRHIAMTAELQLRPDALSAYDASTSRKRHLTIIRDYLNLQIFSQPARQMIAKVMATAAQTKHDLVDLINVAIEELVRQRVELPAFSTLLKAARQARNEVTQALYQQVVSSLTQAECGQINHLFESTAAAHTTPWHQLKQDPGRPTLTHLQELVNRLQWLSPLRLGRAVLQRIPDSKLRHFAAEAQTLDASAMKALPRPKRYTLAITLLNAQYTQALDDLAEMFIKQMQQLHQRSQTALAEYRRAQQSNTDELIATLRDVIAAYQSEGDIPQRFAAISTVIEAHSQALMEQCEAHLTYEGNNYLPLLQKVYKSHRATLFRLLAVLPLRSSTQDASLTAAVAFIQAHRTGRSLWVATVKTAAQGTPEESAVPLLDLSWIDGKWWFLVTGQRQRTPYPSQIHRRHFEACVFSQVRLELKSGDLYIEGSAAYGDYYSQLIDWEEYHATVEDYGQLVNLPVQGQAFVQHVQQGLELQAQTTDQAFPANTAVNYQKDRLVIHRRQPQPPRGLAKLKTLISERLTPVNLLDVLTDTEQWLHWTRYFKPVSGYDAKLSQPGARYLATTFCYGCNIGPSQTARALTEFDRRQLADIHHRHIDDLKLQAAIEAIINAYNRFTLPAHWGTGKHASVDGTKWDVYEQNLLAEYHIRYGGYGGIGYYHVSDTYIALFSHFIPCGVFEAVYLLDGLLKNTSVIQPDTIHGDTHAQSTTVFGLAYLLGITLMPRIRGWQSLKFYRSAPSTHYIHIDQLFSDSVNWNLIQTHLPDMLRVTLSIKAGKIAASTILRKLGTNSAKNKLYQAFQELGYAVRTGFLLHYIHDADLRALIQAATNKSEAFNGFLKWLAFGGEGIIATNNRDEQRKLVKYNHLVANCLIFYNVFEISRILNDLMQEGIIIEAETIAALSPYWTQHINRFGRYSLDMNRRPPAIDFGIPVVSPKSLE
jgi:TnpA family transposase